MSSGQSARNGSSVEPGLPNTFLMPNARNRAKVASLTVTDLLAALAGLRDDMQLIPEMSQASLGGAKRRSSPPVDGLVGEVKQCAGTSRHTRSVSCAAANHPAADPACQIRTRV